MTTVFILYSPVKIPNFISFHPQAYQRTRQLLESLVLTQIVTDGKGYKAEIYFDIDGLNYEDGKWTEEEVFDVAMNYEFPHGSWIGAGGKPIWKGVKPKLDAEAIDILVDMLRAEGIPVKKG